MKQSVAVAHNVVLLGAVAAVTAYRVLVAEPAMERSDVQVQVAVQEETRESVAVSVDVIETVVPDDMELASEVGELPLWEIPNIPSAAEAYFAPDNTHLIAQTRDPDAKKTSLGTNGALTYTFSDTGTNIVRINDSGQDACSYFFPDNERVIFTSTRDHLDLPVGNWSSEPEYPKGAELYSAKLDGSDLQRLTNNEDYEAEVSVSPDGQWVVYGRNINGTQDLWRMRPDGSEQQQITFTDEWQEGAPFYMKDNETILYRAWKKADYGVVRPTPMTVFTIKHDGTDMRAHTDDTHMNWAPHPAPNGRHYVFVKVSEQHQGGTPRGPGNWDVYLGDLAGGEPVQLTTYSGFDGFPSVSPNGQKMAFARAMDGFMSGMRTMVMDVSSLGLGPDNYTPMDPSWGRPVDTGAP